MRGTENNEVILEPLLKLIGESRGLFRVTTADDVAAARSASVERTRELDELLDRSAQYGESWKKYLLWDRLLAQLANGAKADPAVLADVLERLDRDEDGLELPAMLRLRAALFRYRQRILDRPDKELPEEFQRRLDQLAEQVSKIGANNLAKPLDTLAEQLHWFQRHEQIPKVVAAVRQLAPQPNCYVFVSDQFVATTTREQVDRIDPLTDCVLGTTIHGTSHLVGAMAAAPVGSQDEIKLVARLRGDATTEGRGYNGPVRADMVGEARIAVDGQIRFGPDGFQVGTATAHVSATGRPTSMWTTCQSRLVSGVITSVARRRAAKTQQLGDCIASRHAEQRLQVQVADELQSRLDKLQQQYLTRFRHPLLRHEMFPETFQASSTDRGAHMRLLLANSYQLGARQPPPSLQPNAAICLRWHQSAVNNLADSMLAGRTLSEVELRNFLNQLRGQAAEQQDASDKDVLYITFADQRPLTCQFDGQIVTLKLRADHFIVNRRRYAPMNVSAPISPAALCVGRSGNANLRARDYSATFRNRGPGTVGDS